jgi:hypothetical protein
MEHARIKAVLRAADSATTFSDFDSILGSRWWKEPIVTIYYECWFMNDHVLVMYKDYVLETVIFELWRIESDDVIWLDDTINH